LSYARKTSSLILYGILSVIKRDGHNNHFFPSAHDLVASSRFAFLIPSLQMIDYERPELSDCAHMDLVNQSQQLPSFCGSCDGTTPYFLKDLRISSATSYI